LNQIPRTPDKCSDFCPRLPTWPPRAREMAFQFCYERLRDNVSLDLRFNIELLAPSVLLLEILDRRHQRHIHATALARQLIERRRADPMISTQMWQLRPRLSPLEHRHDLAACRSLSLHVEPPPTRKFYFPDPHLSRKIINRSALDRTSRPYALHSRAGWPNPSSIHSSEITSTFPIGRMHDQSWRSCRAGSRITTKNICTIHCD
jgi:hypothetical protein